MHLFRRPDYHSETSQFLHQLKKERPHLAAKQLEGRARLWDKQVNHQAAAECERGKVAHKAYAYQTQP